MILPFWIYPQAQIKCVSPAMVRFKLLYSRSCVITAALTIRASERKFSRGYEGQYRAQILLGPQALSGPMPLNRFCPMGVDLRLKVRG